MVKPKQKQKQGVVKKKIINLLKNPPTSDKAGKDGYPLGMIDYETWQRNIFGVMTK